MQDKTPVWDVPARLRAAIACRDTLDSTTPQGLVQYCDNLADRLLAALCIEHSIFADSVSVSTGVRRTLLIERIQAFIEARLDEKIEIDSVAAEFGISRRHPHSGVSRAERVEHRRVHQSVARQASGRFVGRSGSHGFIRMPCGGARVALLSGEIVCEIWRTAPARAVNLALSSVARSYGSITWPDRADKLARSDAKKPI